MANSVAVLLAAYNGKEWLQEQLDSINKQSKVTLDIFISVDLSDDDTYEWCQEQEGIYSNITVLNYGERFGGAAKNFFRLIRDVDFSGYDYIALADQDDIWLDNKLCHAITIMKEEQLDAFSSDVTAFWSDGREKLVKKSYPQKSYDHYFEAAGPGCTYVLSMQSMQKFKTFLINNWAEVNEVSLHDWMIYSYYRANKFKWHINAVPLMRYRQHESNQVGFNSGYKAALTRLAMIRDNWFSEQVNKIFRLVGKSSDTELKLNRIFLVTHFWQLRRRPRDAFAILIMLISGVL